VVVVVVVRFINNNIIYILRGKGVLFTNSLTLSPEKMFKWLIDKQIRAELADLAHAIAKQNGKIDALEEQVLNFKMKWRGKAEKALKTQEELNELFEAISKDNKDAIKDAYGDILVTLVMGCACADLDLVECFKGAYEEIKGRTGRLGADGIFYKD